MAVNLPWVEKYRPRNLDDLISHKEIITTSERLIINMISYPLKHVFCASSKVHSRRSSSSFAVLWPARYWQNQHYIGLC
jgi:hypothetical protein